MGAAVPFAGATMTGFGGAAATSGASLFAASAVAPIAGAIATPSIFTTPAAMGGGVGGGGFFSGISSAFSGLNNALSRPLFSTDLFGDISLKTIGNVVSTGGSIIQSIRQGQIMKQQYELQSIQTMADMETKRANAAIQAAERLRILRQVQATNLNYAASRMVDALSGSAHLMNVVSSQEYGEDYKLDLFNVNQLVNRGKVNAAIYKNTGKNAATEGFINAAIKLGEGAYRESKLGT